MPRILLLPWWLSPVPKLPGFAAGASGVRDITLDQPLLCYLATGNATAREDETAYVVKAGRWPWLDSYGVLRATHKYLGWQRCIPMLGKRGPLIWEVLGPFIFTRHTGPCKSLRRSLR